MNRTRGRRAVAVLVMVGLTVAACGGDDDTADEPAADEPAADEPAAEEPASTDDESEPAAEDGEGDEPSEEGGDTGVVTIGEGTACAEAAADIDPGEFAPSGDLTFATTIGVNSLNPHDDQTPATFGYYGWTYEGLVRQQADGAIVPWLAKCWDVSEDGAAVTFALRDGVTFHDGTPFNADAVVQNIEFVKTAGPPQVIPPVAGQLGIVDSVEAVDDLTVQFNLSGPGEVLLLSGLIRNSGLMVAPSALGSAAENPLGTGPYVWTDSTADLTENNFAANENYWQPGLVGLESASVVVNVDDTNRVDSFNAGQYDVAVVRPPDFPNITADYSGAESVRIGFVVADWTGEQVPALANRDVRCAMAQALNRAGVQNSLGAPGSEVKQWASDPSDYAYIDDLDVADFDIEAAKAAFEATGESGFTFRNGHLPGSFWPVLSSAWATALAELGITMENEALDPPDAAQMFVSLGEARYPIQIIPFNEPNPLMSLIARTGQATFNPSGVSPDGVDELVASARGKSFEDGEADVAAALKIMFEECVWIFNNTLSTYVAYQDDVSGVTHTTGFPVHFWPQGVTKG